MHQYLYHRADGDILKRVYSQRAILVCAEIRTELVLSNSVRSHFSCFYHLVMTSSANKVLGARKGYFARQ
jgi:hypothetical protein